MSVSGAASEERLPLQPVATQRLPSPELREQRPSRSVVGKAVSAAPRFAAVFAGLPGAVAWSTVLDYLGARSAAVEDFDQSTAAPSVLAPAAVQLLR